MSALFYENPVLLNAEEHGSAGLKTVENFEFARTGNAIPINLVEFALVARHYPIAFVGEGENQYPVAIVGLEESNLFVDADNAWQKGHYIPAYVRRYPFIFADDADRGLLSLCIDSKSVDAEGGVAAFFNEGKPSEATDQALEFCKAYHAAALDTQPFTKALEEKGLLIEREANAELVRGGAFTLRGFKTIDGAKLAELDGETLKDWNQKGWLGAIYAQLQSTLNWGELIDLLDANKGAAATAKDSKKKG